MAVPASLVLGGVIGAVLGVIWGDPFRNSRGQFTTRGTGYGTWILQGIIGAALGASLTNAALTILEENPIIAAGGTVLVSYVVYHTYVDPR